MSFPFSERVNTLSWDSRPDWSNQPNEFQICPWEQFRAGATEYANEYLSELQGPYDENEERATMDELDEESAEYKYIKRRQKRRRRLLRGGEVAHCDIWCEEYCAYIRRRYAVPEGADISESWFRADAAMSYVLRNGHALTHNEYAHLVNQVFGHAHVRFRFLEDNIIRLLLNRLTLTQIKDFGRWLHAQIAAWLPPNPRSTDLGNLPWPRYRDSIGLTWLKVRAYVRDYLWRARVEQADLARHIDSHHGVHARAALDHIIAPMLEGPASHIPASAQARPHGFPPPRTSQALRNALTGIDSEFGGINRGQPKRNAPEEEEEEEEETEGPNASAAAAAPKPRKHPRKQQ